MGDAVSRSSVCILRIQTEIDRLLISVTTERYTHHGLAISGEPRVRHFADPDRAIEEVAKFVRSHQPHGASS
jgi:hypothetical protein